MRPPPPRTDYWLWLAFSGGLLLAILLAYWVVSGATMFAHFGEAALLFAGFAVACAMVGWFAQEVGRACGVRLSGQSKPDEAADYDDKPSPPARAYCGAAARTSARARCTRSAVRRGGRMEFAAARQQFEALAEARGWAIAREGPAVAIRSGDDCLRLRPTSSGVVFEITHGPTAGPPAGWLDLHSDPTRPGQPPLADCIEYGLDLMEPGRGVSTATVPAVPTPSDPKPSAGVCHFGVLFQNRAFYLWPAFRRKVTKP